MGEYRLFEAEVTANRLEHLPRDIPLTYAGFCSIHRYVFEPVFAWAGQIRTVDIAKADMFCLARFIEPQMRRRFAALQAENELRGLDVAAFIERAAEHIAELNAIHPFREGNGRTLRAFLEMLCERAGYPIALERIGVSAWMEASIRSFRDGDYEPMRKVIAAAMVDRASGIRAG